MITIRRMWIGLTVRVRPNSRETTLAHLTASQLADLNLPPELRNEIDLRREEETRWIKQVMRG